MVVQLTLLVFIYKAPFPGANLTQDQKRFNTALISVRTSVEWLFGLVSNYLNLLNFRKMQRIGMSPVGKVHIVCSILENAHTCFYGNLILETFELEPPSTRDYFQ